MALQVQVRFSLSSHQCSDGCVSASASNPSKYVALEAPSMTSVVLTLKAHLLGTCLRMCAIFKSCAFVTRRFISSGASVLVSWVSSMRCGSLRQFMPPFRRSVCISRGPVLFCFCVFVLCCISVFGVLVGCLPVHVLLRVVCGSLP